METSLVEYGLASVLSLILLILTIVWKRSSSSSSLPPSPVPPPSSLPADDPVDQAGPKKGTKNSRRRATRSNSQKNPIPPSPALPPISSPLYRPSVVNQEVPSLDLSPSSSSSSSSSYSGSSPLDRAVSSGDQGESSSSSSSKDEAKMTKTDLIIAKYITPYYKPIKFEALAPEIETGNVEYKLKLSPPCDERFEQLVSQMQYRIEEGNGEAIYEIGVEDHGSPHGLLDNDLAFSLDVLTTMATNLGAVINILRIRDGREGKVAEVLIRKQSKHEQYTEMRVAIIGNVDAGKSTLLGVLSRGALDNGRGKARATVFRHKHEIESGRTSDVSREVLGFDSKGDIVNYSSVRAMSSSEICESSSKVVTFVDLAGHEKYLRTTVFGLTGNCPDYAMCVIASNNGVIGMTKEHYHLTLALKIPCFFVVTKVDICPANILEETLTTLRKMVKAPGSSRIPTILNNEDEVVAAVRNIPTERIAPIFLVSNVNGTNLELLRLFLNLLPSRKDWDALSQQPPLLYVDNIFPMVSGVGIVLSGTLIQGVMSVNQNLMLGPDEFGKFIPVTIKSIHTNRIPVNSASAGHSVSFALKKIKKTSVRKGQVLIDPSLNPQSTWQFEADVFVITHSTTINQDYEAVIHCGCARQTATIRHVDSVLRANSRGRVRFQFKYRPEFIAVGERLIFREGKTKGIGTVVNVLYDTEPPSTHLHPDHKMRPGHPKN